MAARPPPARPHIGIRPSNHFNSVSSTGEWGEDDAWDSGSDAESPRQSSLVTKSWNRSSPSSTTAPRPVPKPLGNASSSTLAFSYTHITAPNPSSYSPKDDPLVAPKGGWTLVKKSSDRKTSKPSSTEQVDEVILDSEVQADADVECSMILGDLEPEAGECDPAAPLAITKTSYNQGTIREDAHKIVHGTTVPLCSMEWHSAYFL